jgi:putative ABC transport system permease protein
MPRIGRGRHELFSSIWRAPVRDEVSAELQFHIDMLTREYVAQGLSPDAAREAAVLRFGDPARIAAQSLTSARERDASMNRRDHFDSLRHDLRFAIRQLHRAPGITALALLTFALGIGATTAIFSLLYQVVLRPFPFAHPERVVYVAEGYQGQNSNASIGNFVDLAAQSRSFDAMGAISYQSFNLAEGNEPERVYGARMTASGFRVFGVAPVLGRVFSADEDQPGSDGVVVLSHGLWARRFAQDRDVVGRELRMSGRPYRIIGVMPAGFDPTLSGEQLWVPAAFTPTQRAQHDEHYLDVVGLLKEGVSAEEATAELTPVMRDLVARYPNHNIDRTVAVLPLDRIVIGPVRDRLFTLFGAVLLVLLIACTNVATLLLARVAARAKELAIRAAIGAGRGRVIRQLLTEAGVLSLAASVVGVAMAWGMVRMLVSMAPPGTPRLEMVRVDGVAFLFAVGVALLSSVLAGVIPALRATARDPQQDLREGGRGAGIVRDRIRNALVTAEVALALTLLVGAGLLVRTALAVQRVDPGFDPRGMLMARVSLPEGDYREPARIVQALEALASALGTMPGVVAAGITSQAPMGPGGGSNGLLPEGRAPTAENIADARLRMITPGYLAAMRIPIRAGRAFNDRDVKGTDLVTIVSEATAKRLWPNENPIGKRVLCCEGSKDDPRMKTVVGVVGDVRSDGLSAGVRPEFYLPIAQAPDVAWDWIQRSVTLVGRTSAADATTLIAAMRAAMRDVDPNVPLHRITTMDDALRLSTATTRFNTLLLTALGLVGVVLAAIGIFGVVAFFVGARSHEISVRRALGASGRDVLSLLTWQGMRPVILGAAIGVVGALATSRVLSASLVGVTATDPLTFVAAMLAILGVGLLATLLPARRALRVEPVRALQGG